MEALFNVLNIDAHKGRDVEIFDFPREYLNTDMPEDKFNLLKIEGIFVYIMCELHLEHKKMCIYRME